jgi:hypothetical protein
VLLSLSQCWRKQRRATVTGLTSPPQVLCRTLSRVTATHIHVLSCSGLAQHHLQHAACHALYITQLICAHYGLQHQCESTSLLAAAFNRKAFLMCSPYMQMDPSCQSRSTCWIGCVSCTLQLQQLTHGMMLCPAWHVQAGPQVRLRSTIFNRV